MTEEMTLAMRNPLLALTLLVVLLAAGAAAAPEEPAAMWIWHPEEQADHLGVGAVTRYFRATVDLPAAPTAAYLVITADDEFTLWVNGQEVGSGKLWMELRRFDLAAHLVAGRNTLAVSATNTAPGPAALIAWGQVTCANGATVPLRTDATWRVGLEAPEGWLTDFDDAGWPQAVELADVRGGPWAGRMQPVSVPAFENALMVQGSLSRPELLPRPQVVQSLDSVMPVVTDGRVVLELATTPDLADSYAVEQIRRALQVMTDNRELELPVVSLDAPVSGPRLTIAQAPARELSALCRQTGVDPSELKAQGYALAFTPGDPPGALLVGADLPGVVYGSSTFVQLLQKQGVSVTARQVRITDWPSIPMRGVRSVGASPAMADWCAFYKMNVLVTGFDWRQPLPERLGELNRDLARRGIALLSECHPGGEAVPFIFTNQAHRQALLDRVREAIAMGLPALDIMVDDEPNAPQSDEDVAKYGPGLVGLGKAQMEMMSEVAAVAGDQIEIIFCPRVYYDPYQKGVYPTQPSADEAEYTRLVGTLPPNIQLWTTQPKPSYVEELNRTWGRPPYIYHNLFYSSLADVKLFFQSYPVPTPELVKQVRGFAGSGSGHRYAREWRVNYLGLAANTWNPNQPVGLREAFIREYGEQATPALLQYAQSLGSQLEPGVPIMADVWDQPDEWPGVRISMGFAGRLNRFKAQPDHIARLRQWAAEAQKAATMDWSGSGLEDEQIEVLRLNARRIELNYATLADLLTVQMNLADGTVADNRTLVARALEQAQEIRDIIDSLMLDSGSCHDWELLDRAEKLAQQVQ